MPDIKIYKTKDLVLQVRRGADPQKLNLDQWANFLDVLCGDREYQKEAIRAAMIYLASGEYRSIEDLVMENLRSNIELRKRYRDERDYLDRLQMPHRLSGVIDLATGSGKSYVMYGIAQIALGIGLVDKVLVLCPSLTIESGLKEKFLNLSGDNRIKMAIPAGAKRRNPRITDANSTIKNGDAAVENIHAVYERTGSSIRDSLKGVGKRTLVLSDEIHHAYNASFDSDIKKWKNFLMDETFGFRYVLGFTGTAYFDNEYFNDVIYRYSIRQAIEDCVVKSIDYVAKDESIDQDEKLQKIYDNHDEFGRKYRLIKPLTILVTKDIAKAKTLRGDLIDFLEKHEGLPREAVERKVLVVTSHKDHKKNVMALKFVDDKESPVEWIVSVSMLTEGWDVKNVFQIVPWEDRAFNSKLLIAQVLGRGLRVPEAYKSPQPKVRVFNHDAWSRNIRGLIDEVLEVEMRLVSVPLTEGTRTAHHFDVYNIDVTKKERVVKAEKETVVFDYTKGYANLVAQVEQVESETEYEDISGGVRAKSTVVQRRTVKVDDVVLKIIETFKTREFEAQVRFPKGTYTKENLPPEKELREYVLESMRRVGIKSDALTEDNANRIYSAFQTLLRPRASTVNFERVASKPVKISTREMERETMAVGAVRQGATVFYTDDYEKECTSEQVEILKEIIADESLPRSSCREINRYCMKTPVSLVLTKMEPERKFAEAISGAEICNSIDAWVKSRDQNFYSIEYSYRRGEHQIAANFNPDFFLKFGSDIVVIEIKADGDASDENKAKYRWAKKHFNMLNAELAKVKIKQSYYFHFLSPINYAEFVRYACDGRLVKGEFRSALEDLLEK